MSNFKFRGFIPAVTKYVKSKPLVEVKSATNEELLQQTTTEIYSS